MGFAYSAVVGYEGGIPCGCLSLLFCCLAFCEQPSDKPSPSTGWQQLGLAKTTIEGVTVYYEKSLEPNLPVFVGELRKFLDERDSLTNILTKSDQIVRDINRILGLNDPNIEKQKDIFTAMAGMFRKAKPIFYLATRPTIKSFVRAGGQLPDCTYDKSADMVYYRPHWGATSANGPLKEFELTLPIAPDKDFAEQVAGILGMLGQSMRGPGVVGVAIHEVTEITLIKRAKPTDGYWRWFSDGFANAITIEILRNHLGRNAADEFAGAFDVGTYEDIKNEINLRYWMAGQHCILPKEVLTDAEGKIDSARYAYATLEAQRLIDKNGIDCVRRIMDEISVKPSRTGSDLLSVIKNVTGEDIDARFAAYQTFQSRQEGMQKYARAFNEASGKQDREQMLINIFRIHELRLPDQALQLLLDYSQAAMLLFRMDKEQAADSAMANCIEFFSNPGFTQGKEAASEAFVAYALETGKSRKALEAANDVLKASPNHINALSVQMFINLENKQLSEAKELALKIISLSKDEKSTPYKSALKVLEIDPNQPPPKQ
jgi:hypothetical protein